MKTLFLNIFLFLNLTIFQANAQSIDSNVTSTSTKGFYGYIDTYYAYDFNKPVNKYLPLFVYSHNRHNEFNINNAILGYKFENEKTRASFGLHAGTYVERNYANEPVVLRNIYEAYAGFSPVKKIWIDAGIFPSHIGYESAISKDNLTLTRSIMADNTPYYETGVRITYNPGKKWTLRALVLNGWQNIRDRNANKALGTQVEFTPSDKWKLNSSTYFGNEEPDNRKAKYRFFHNFFVEYKPLKPLTFAFLLDAGFQKQSSIFMSNGWHPWGGTALIGHYKFNKVFGTGARVEFFTDPVNIVYTPPSPTFIPVSPNRFNAGSTSLNFDFNITENAVFRIEGKFFRATRRIFQTENGSRTNMEGIITTSLAMSF